MPESRLNIEHAARASLKKGAFPEGGHFGASSCVNGGCLRKLIPVRPATKFDLVRPAVTALVDFALLLHQRQGALRYCIWLLQSRSTKSCFVRKSKEKSSTIVTYFPSFAEHSRRKSSRGSYYFTLMHFSGWLFRFFCSTSLRQSRSITSP